MALDIVSLKISPQAILETARAARPSSPTQAQAVAQAEAARESLKSVAGQMDASIAATNRRLSFSVNSKLDEVVVKVIDTDTDKVVREIPAVELQHVYERIREVVGLLFDHSA